MSAWANEQTVVKLRRRNSAEGGKRDRPHGRNIGTQACRDTTRKAVAQTELNLARDIKGNMKGFFKLISSKRKTRKKCGSTAEWGRCPCDKGLLRPALRNPRS